MSTVQDATSRAQAGCPLGYKWKKKFVEEATCRKIKIGDQIDNRQHIDLYY